MSWPDARAPRAQRRATPVHHRDTDGKRLPAVVDLPLHQAGRCRQTGRAGAQATPVHRTGDETAPNTPLETPVTTCTPRELRIIADHVERLTKARVVNTQLGVDTLPDEVIVDFPNSFRGTVHWTPARRGTNGAERTAIARHARHRDCYQLDTASLELIGGPRVTRGAQLAQAADGYDADAAAKMRIINARTPLHP